MPGSDNINIELTKPLLKEFPLSDKYASAFSYISIEEYPIHSHTHMELIYVVKGSLKVKVGVSDYVLNSGEFTIIDPFELHGLYHTGEANSTYILELNTEFYDPCEEEIIFVSAYGLYQDAAGKDFPKIKETIDRIFELHLTTMTKYSDDILIFPMGISDSDADYEKILLRSLINYFELYFTSEYFLLSDHKENSLRDNALQANRLKSILSYFYQNFPKKIHLQDVADLTFVNRYHISHLVKSGIGLTFSELLQHIRIEKAEIYLLATDMPINQIVFELGFSSYRYFNQHFKNLFHMTPNAYRKKYKYSTIRYKNISYIVPTTSADVSEAFHIIPAPKAAESEIKTPAPCLIPLSDLFSSARTQCAYGKNHQPTKTYDAEFPSASPLYDSPYFPAILLGFMNNDIRGFIDRYPCFFDIDINADSECEFSCLPGNMTRSGIRKSVFYLREFLEPFINGKLIRKPGFMAAAEAGELHMLFYHIPEDLSELSSRDFGDPHILKRAEYAASQADKKYIIELKGTDKSSRTFIKTRKLHMEFDSFIQWRRIGSPSHVTEDVISLLNESSVPNTKLSRIDGPFTDRPYTVTLSPFEVHYIALLDFTRLT